MQDEWLKTLVASVLKVIFKRSDNVVVWPFHDFYQRNFRINSKIDWFDLLTFIRRVLQEIDEFGNVRELGLWLFLVRHVSTSGVDVKGSQEVTVIVTNVVVLYGSFEKSGK